MAESPGALRFSLQVEGINSAEFMEVSGLDAEIEIIEARVSGKGGNLIIYKIPGALKWPNIVFKRGITDNMELWNWFKKIEDGLVEQNRKNGTITCYSPDNKAVAKYNFKFGFPCKIKGPHVDASKNELSIEEMEIAHNGLERVAP